jgi:hypothetical protein
MVRRLDGTAPGNGNWGFMGRGCFGALPTRTPVPLGASLTHGTDHYPLMVTPALRRILVASLAVAAGTSASLIAGGVGSAATNADFTGSWSLVDHVTAGPNQGQDYPWQGSWTQNGSQLTGTGTYSISGSVSGSTATFTTTSGGSYVATFHLTMSADGSRLPATRPTTGAEPSA